MGVYLRSGRERKRKVDFDRLCFPDRRSSDFANYEKLPVHGGLCSRTDCKGAAGGGFSNSKRCALRYRDRFYSSRSNDPSSSCRDRLCFRDRRFSDFANYEKVPVHGGLCPRSDCKGAAGGGFSNSNRRTQRWRDRFSSSRSSDPSPSCRDRLCFRDRRFSDFANV